MFATRQGSLVDAPVGGTSPIARSTKLSRPPLLLLSPICTCPHTYPQDVENSAALFRPLPLRCGGPCSSPRGSAVIRCEDGGEYMAG